jgi:hypothetical protein
MIAVRVRERWKEIHADASNFQSFDDFIERAFLVNKKQDPSSYEYSLVNDYINKNGKFAKKKQNPVKMSMLVLRSLLSRMLET